MAMAQARITVTVATAMLLSTFCVGVLGQAAAPGPAGGAPDCMTYLLNASDCLSYVTAGSNLTTPEKGCCPEMAGLVDSNPICLCYLLGGDNGLGFQIDVNKALKLPSICSVTTPPVSLCSEIGVPVGSPTSGGGGMAPAGAPTSNLPYISPSADPSMSMSPDAGSAPAAAVPSSTTSEASSVAGNALALFVSFLVAFVATILV